MTWPFLISAIIVLMALVAVTRVLRRLVWAFAIAAAGLLVLHYQSDPAQATGALAALGGGLAVAGPLRGLVLRFFI